MPLTRRELNPASVLYSRSISRVRKEVPSDSPSKNHQLLIQGGFFRQEAAGIYTILPFGVNVVNKIQDHIRHEMIGLGGQEVAMPSLTPRENWITTGRWDGIDVLFRVNSSTGNREYGLAPTTEEIATPVAQGYIRSYKDLPIAFYQFGRKFRDEKRAKSGLIRGREFTMKDMYSFHSSTEDFDYFYGMTKNAYIRLFSAFGIDAKVTDASGGEYTKKSTHEFHAVSDAGEDTIVTCCDCTFAQNIEISDFKAGDSCGECGGGLSTVKSIEVGHIFDLGDTFTKAFGLKYQDQDGLLKNPIMGCYGIGVSRLVGTIAEIHHDSNGIVWPRSVAPFDLHIVGLNLDDSEVRNTAFKIYEEMSRKGYSILFDDRQEVTARDKFFVADLVGVPDRLTISTRTLQSRSVEHKERNSTTSVLIGLDNLNNYFLL